MTAHNITCLKLSTSRLCFHTETWFSYFCPWWRLISESFMHSLPHHQSHSHHWRLSYTVYHTVHVKIGLLPRECDSENAGSQEYALWIVLCCSPKYSQASTLKDTDITRPRHGELWSLDHYSQTHYRGGQRNQCMSPVLCWDHFSVALTFLVWTSFTVMFQWDLEENVSWARMYKLNRICAIFFSSRSAAYLRGEVQITSRQTRVPERYHFNNICGPQVAFCNVRQVHTILIHTSGICNPTQHWKCVTALLRRQLKRGSIHCISKATSRTHKKWART